MPPWPPRVALVTGAASGLGLHLAQMLMREGVAIAAVDINADRLQSFTAPSGWAVADVTDAAAMRQAVEKLEREVGPVDLLIASAGIGTETSALAFNAGDFARVVQVNLIGVANTVSAVLPGMLARQRGHLVALSSLASYRGLPFMAAYCASKSGVTALMEAIRVEVKPRGILTTTVCPGWVQTPMTANLKVPMPNMLSVEDAAQRILTAIRQQKKHAAFPARTAFQVRLLNWLPAAMSDWMIERMIKKVARKR